MVRQASSSRAVHRERQSLALHSPALHPIPLHAAAVREAAHNSAALQPITPHSVPAPFPASPQRRPLVRAVETELSSPAPPQRDELAIHAPGLPPLTHRIIGTVAIFAFEAVEGTRHVGQLGMWITAEVSRHLTEYRTLIRERRSRYQDTRRIVPTVRTVRASQPATHVVEATVILNAEGRARAVALRFGVNRVRWQATSITVL